MGGLKRRITLKEKEGVFRDEELSELKDVIHNYDQARILYDEVKTVSYTHLDVYKRQECGSCVLRNYPVCRESSEVCPVFSGDVYKRQVVNRGISQKAGIAGTDYHQVHTMIQGAAVGYIVCNGCLLYTSLTIPMEKGWSARVNGEKVDLEEGANALMLVPVNTGKNHIEID